MSEQTGPGTDISAADLQVDGDAGTGELPATNDPDAYEDSELGLGDGPDAAAPSDSGS